MIKLISGGCFELGVQSQRTRAISPHSNHRKINEYYLFSVFKLPLKLFEKPIGSNSMFPIGSINITIKLKYMSPIN